MNRFARKEYADKLSQYKMRIKYYDIDFRQNVRACVYVRAYVYIRAHVHAHLRARENK